MTTELPEVDVVVVGVGWTGSILARELTKAGLKVVGLERGPRRTPGEDFTVPGIRDDLKYAVRQELFQDTQMETMSLRHARAEMALPIRRLGALLPGTGWRGRRALERRYVAAAADRSQAAHASARTLRSASYPRRYDDHGLSHQLR